jgi:hypothetical protein
MSERHKPESISGQQEHGERDDLIRSAIASYGDAEPDSDLAQRILLRVAAQPTPIPLSRRFRLAFALPIAACAIALFALLQIGSNRKPENPEGHTHTAIQPRIENLAKAARPAPRATLRARRERLPKTFGMHAAVVATEAGALPKRNVFPTPKPLSPSEQALVQFVERSPTIARNSFIDARNQSDAPLSVAAIEIQPLETPELGMN